MGASYSGARVKGLRRELGLSQVELAAILDVSNVTVNRWEKRPGAAATGHGRAPAAPGASGHARAW